MPQIVTLFKNQKEVEQAMNALDSSAIEDIETRIIEEWSVEEESQANVAPVPNLDPGMTGVPLAEVSKFHDLNLSDEVEMFLKRSVQGGGALLVVELDDDDDVAQAKRILKKQDGRIASE